MPACDTPGSVYIFGAKSVDIRCGLWYYNSAPREWATQKKLQKSSKKVLTTNRKCAIIITQGKGNTLPNKNFAPTALVWEKVGYYGKDDCRYDEGNR